jgi:hypothetical protein
MGLNCLERKLPLVVARLHEQPHSLGFTGLIVTDLKLDVVALFVF